MATSDIFRIIHSLPNNIVLFDLQKTIVALSAGMLSLSQSRKETIIGKSFEAIFEHLPDVERFRHVEDLNYILDEVIKSKRPYIDDIRQCVSFPASGRSPSYWQSTTTPVLNEADELIYITYSPENVTEKVMRDKMFSKVEHELLTQTNLSEILDRQSDGFFILNRDEKIIFANQILSRFGQLDKEEILGKPFKTLFPSPDTEKFLLRYREVMKNREAQAFEESYGDKILSVNAYPTSDGSAAIFYRDITELVKTRDKLKIITNELPAFVGYFDKEGRYQFANQSYEKWFGLKAEDIIGKTREEFADPASSSRAARFEQAALRGEAVGFEICLSSPRGERRWFDIKYTPHIEPDSGEINGVIVIGNDVTERVEALKRRDEFLSIASHELKTPLTSLKLQTHLAIKKMEIKKGEVSGADLMKLVAAADKSTNRLTRLVEDMLDISRIENGKLSLDVEEFDLSELINDLVRHHSVYHQQIFYRFTETHIINADRFRIEQVLTNLIQNAIKYGKESKIEISSVNHHRKVEIKIKDHGPGIDSNHHEKIFQRFERAIGPNGISGLGLGLYICKEIVERHQGTIKVESELNKGATFIVTLPLL